MCSNCCCVDKALDPNNYFPYPDSQPREELAGAPTGPKGSSFTFFESLLEYCFLRPWDLRPCLMTGTRTVKGSHVTHPNFGGACGKIRVEHNI